MNEEALRRVLARLKAKGWSIATQDLPCEQDATLDQEPGQVPPQESPSPRSAEEVADLSLDTFGRLALTVKVWSRVLDGEIWFVSGEAEVQALQKQGVPREMIFAAQELIDLLSVFGRDPEVGRLVLEGKKLFKGSLRLEETP